MNRMALWLAGALGTVAVLHAGCSSGDDDGTGGNTTTDTCNGCYSCGEFIIDCMDGCPEGDPRDLLCTDSLPLMAAVNDCLCDPALGNCQDDCRATCSLATGAGGGGQGGAGQGGDTDACVPCQGAAVQDVCNESFTACSQDTGCNGP